MGKCCSKNETLIKCVTINIDELEEERLNKIKLKNNLLTLKDPIKILKIMNLSLILN